MKKLRSKAGLTLMEMMAALLVMVLLVVGMGTGMDAGMRVYRDSKFETDSAALVDIMNTSMSDLFRYAENITSKETLSSEDQTKLPAGMEFVFTNMEFGVMDGYFQISTEGKTKGMIQLKNLRDNGKAIDLVNAGAYPDLTISDLHVIYVAPDATELTYTDKSGAAKTTAVSRGGFFYVSYTVKSEVDSAKTRDVETVVRQMNVE